ncbi:MAG: response regulator [Gammaproteobacteria bacterium]|nr:response regulator [Gammaproteobacteria bacterium]
MLMNTTLPKVLVVDDEAYNLEIIGEYLEDIACSLTMHVNSNEAWQHLQDHPGEYSAILLDWMMPGLDGLEFLHRVKHHADLLDIPIIMQTARDSKEDLLQGIAGGAYYYLTKPYDQATLKGILKAALEDFQHYRTLEQQLNNKDRSRSLTQSADFKFRTLEETSQLSTLIANACPEPDKVVSGISELLINAIEHGNLAIGYDEKATLKRENKWHDEIEHRLTLPEYRDKEAEVSFQHHGTHITITIKDQGKGFDWQKFIEFDPERAFDCNGRGIAMAKLLSFDDLEYTGCGNEAIARIAVVPGVEKK